MTDIIKFVSLQNEIEIIQHINIYPKQRRLTC